MKYQGCSRYSRIWILNFQCQFDFTTFLIKNLKFLNLEENSSNQEFWVLTSFNSGFGFTSTGTHDSHFVVFSAGGGETPGHGGQRTLKSGHHFWVLFKEFSNFHVWHKTFGFFGKYGDQHINRVTFTSYSYLTQKIDEKCQNVKFISRSNLEFW